MRRRHIIPSLPAALLGAMAMFGAGACQDDPDDTGIFVDIRGFLIDPPNAVTFSWYGPQGQAFESRSVSLTPNAEGVPGLFARIFVEVPNGTGTRRALVRAEAPDTAWGAASIEIVPNTWKAVRLDLTRDPFPDQDGDGIPDPIDICPGADDRAACPAGDAGADSGSDAAPDGGMDAGLDASVG